MSAIGNIGPIIAEVLKVGILAACVVVPVWAQRDTVRKLIKKYGGGRRRVSAGEFETLQDNPGYRFEKAATLGDFKFLQYKNEKGETLLVDPDSGQVVFKSEASR